MKDIITAAEGALIMYAIMGVISMGVAALIKGVYLAVRAVGRRGEKAP
jgi:hypothetical protein